MKKWIVTGLLALALVGCSEEETTKQEPAKNPIVEEKTEEKVEVQAEVTDHVYYKWSDDSIGGMEQVSTYAVIKNTGTIPVDVLSASVTYLDGSGEVIGVTEANNVYQNIYPSIIAPGEVAYMAITDDGGDSFKDLKNVEVKVSPREMIVTSEKLKTDKVSVKKDDFLSVTGFMKNESDKQADTVQLAAGLYDVDNKFVGAVLPGSDQQWMLAPEEDASFDISVPTFPNDQIEKVDHAEVIGTSILFEE